MQRLHNIIDNDYDQWASENSNNSNTRLIMKDNKLTCLLEGWYISISAHHITDVDDINEQEQPNDQY